MKRRGFFRKLAEAVLSIALARSLGAETPRAEVEQQFSVRTVHAYAPLPFEPSKLTAFLYVTRMAIRSAEEDYELAEEWVPRS